MKNVSYLEYPENDYRDYLEHHGIPGMKWGVRRYQNPDGSLTTAGKKRQAKQAFKDQSKKDYNKFQNKLKKIDSTAEGNKQIPLTVKASKEYDKALKNNKEKYKAEVKQIKADAKQQKMDRRDIKKIMKNSDIGEESNKENEKLAKRIVKTKEWKDYQKFHNDLVDQVDAIQKKNPNAKITINKKVKEIDNKLAKDYYNKLLDMAEKSSKSQAVAVLKDAGIKQTDENVKYAESILLKNLSKSRKNISRMRTM